MKRGLFFLLALGGFVLSSPAPVMAAGGEGYAQPTFRELTQTMVLLGGLDINDPKVADEYARLMYCDEYTRSFKDDLGWQRARAQVVSRVLEKKEYFRVLYQTVNAVTLGRYDIKTQSFPLENGSALDNVGSFLLLSAQDFVPYCDVGRRPEIFGREVDLFLNDPVTLTRIDYPVDQVDQLLVRIAEAGEGERRLYVRFRFRVGEAIGVRRNSYNLPVSSQLRGDVVAIDFFLDPELTKWVASAPVGRK